MKVYIDGSQQMMKTANRMDFLALSVFSSRSDGDLNNSGKNTPYINGKSEIREIAQVISTVRPPMLLALTL
jgi:hypothetical protein